MTETAQVFIGCSSESLDYAEAISSKLSNFVECQIWNEDILEINRYTFTEIQRKIKESDFCIFLFTSDDIVESRSTRYEAPRDNVILELGLAVGLIGADRVFIVREKNGNLKTPSDLAGINIAYFDKSKSNPTIAVSDACMKIKQKISRSKLRKDLKSITIAVSGAQGVGKTTTVGDLSRYLSSNKKNLNVQVKSEIARNLIKRGIGSDQNTKPEEYALYIKKHLEFFHTPVSFDIKLLDRSLLDVLAFANANNNIHNNWNKMLGSLVEIVVAEIDFYFYIPIQKEVPLEDDGVRNINPLYRAKIDKEILNLLNIIYPSFIELRGNRDDRLNEIIENIRI